MSGIRWKPVLPEVPEDQDAPKAEPAKSRKPGGGGYLYWRKSGWRARITVEVDGVRVRQSFDLKTDNRAVARVKLQRLVEQNAPTKAEAQRVETFKEAADRIVGDSTIRTKRMRQQRLQNHIYPHLGHLPVTAIRAGNVSEVLTEAMRAGQGKQSITHLRNDVSFVLGELWRDEVLPENVARRVRIPKDARQDTRERAVLTDEELIRYLAWTHPEEREQDATLERQVMAVVSRCFGGLRLGDITAISWNAFEIAEGEFPSGWVPRRKTARPQHLEVPLPLRPFLRDWWERAGQPSEGLVFPIRSGTRAGEQRKAMSLAKSLRRDLARAFGIEVLQETPMVRRNGRAMNQLVWTQVRALNPRERELLEPTEYTRPVDFHSFRRAFKQGLANAGVEVTTAMALSGATDLKAHQRYLNNTALAKPVPLRALPNITVRVATATSHGAVPGGHLESHARPECDSLPGKTTCGIDSDPIPKRKVAGSTPAGGAEKSTKGTASSHNPWLDRELADRLLAMALRGMAARIALAEAPGLPS